MTTIETELASVRLALAAAIAEKGEGYVYHEPMFPVYDDESDESRLELSGQCEYVEPVFNGDGTVTEWVPSCLWGHVLHTLGVPISVMRSEGEQIDALDYLPWASEQISKAARASQVVQDAAIQGKSTPGYRPEDHTWGKAVEAFEDTLRKQGVTA